MNTQAAAAPYIGLGGWADPDLLIGPEVYVGGQTDAQARAQFSMWALFPTNLLISQNMLQWSPYALETYSNAELIAINQDPLGKAATRVVGGDLPFPCNAPAPPGKQTLSTVAAAPCNPKDKAQQWTYDAASGRIASAAFPGVLTAQGCGGADGTPVVVAEAGGDGCGGRAQRWAWPASAAGGTAVNSNSGACLDVFNWAGPAVDTWTCNKGTNQQLTLNRDGTISEPSSAPGGGGGAPLCLAAVALPTQNCTNVWGRQLSGGAFGIGLVNNGGGAAPVACDAACFAAVGLAGGAFTVRDLWAHADVGTLTPPYHFSAVVNGSGFAHVYKLTPA